MSRLKRTHYCGLVTRKESGATVSSWGGSPAGATTAASSSSTCATDGTAQVVFNPDHHQECHEAAHRLRSEFVIGIRGVVRERPEGMVNPQLPTGEIEVLADEIVIYNERSCRVHDRRVTSPWPRTSGSSTAISTSAGRRCRRT